MPDTTTTTTDQQVLPPGVAPPPSAAAAGTTTNVPTRSPIGVGYQPSPTNPALDATDANGNKIPYQATVQSPVPLPASRVAAGDTTQLSVPSLVPAKYFTGDDYTIPATLPPEVRAELQQVMIDKGLYGSSKPRIGMGGWQNEDVAAFNQVLAYANASGTDWKAALASMPDMPQDQVQRQVNQVQLSNPQDLKALFRKSVTDLLGGGKVPESMLDNFVSAYQKQELDQQNAQVNAQTVATAADQQYANSNPSGGQLSTVSPNSPEAQKLNTPNAPITTVETGNPTSPASVVTTNPESAQQLAEDTLKKAAPGQYQATQMANVYASLLSAMQNLGAKT